MALQVNAGFTSKVAYSWNIESDNVSKIVFVLDKVRDIVFLCLGMLLWCTVRSHARVEQVVWGQEAGHVPPEHAHPSWPD